MNHTPPPHDPAGSGSTSGTGNKNFFTWLRDTGIVRADDRWMTGVAAGIAHRANIDPTIVRGIFVVLAILGGPGILLYLAGWLLFPDTTGRIHLEEIVRGRANSTVVTVAIIIAAIVALPLIISIIGSIFGGLSFGTWGPVQLLPDWVKIVMTVILWVVVVPAGIIMLVIWLSTRKPQTKTTGGQAPRDSASFVAGSEGTAHSGAPDQTHATGDWAERTAQWGERTAQWGERTAQWGERVGKEYSEAYEASQPGAAHTVLTLALALLVGGAVAAWAYLSSFDHIVTLGLLAAVTVFALSMILAGVRGRRSGWTGFFAFCGVVALIVAPFSTLLPGEARIIPFGSDTTRVTAEDGAVAIFAGNSTVDLTDLTASSDAREFEVWVFAGNVVIELPDDHPVRVDVHLGAGNIRDRQSSEPRSSGLFLDRTVLSQTAGVDDADITHVRVRLLFGNVRIESDSGAPIRIGSAADRHTVTGHDPAARENAAIRDNAAAQHLIAATPLAATPREVMTHALV